jgi:cytosine/adenosine deaminase-related metal-dependent hydrolase
MVATGRSADFIVLDANPLDNIANTRRINKVFLRGAEVDRAGIRAKWQAKWGQWRTNNPVETAAIRDGQ